MENAATGAIHAAKIVRLARGRRPSSLTPGTPYVLARASRAAPRKNQPALLHERLMPQTDHSEEWQHYAHVIPDPRPARMLQVI